MNEALPRITWPEFLKLFGNRWKPGEHVFISNQTGGGKTQLMLELMSLRKYGVIFNVKPRDPILKEERASEFTKLREFNPKWNQYKVMVTPPSLGSTLETAANQRMIFKHAIESIFNDGGWTVSFDEVAYMSKQLKLAAEVEYMHQLARADKISLISATQRPRYIPVLVPQSATHAFVGMTSRVDDLKIMAELGGDSRETLQTIRQLRDKHDFVYIDTQGKIPLAVVNTQK